MTDRESPGPQSGSSTPARSSASPAGPLSPLPFAASAAPSFWEEWYREASDAQRRQALELAREQTVVVAHQLSAPERPSPARRSLLAELLAGNRVPLEPPPPVALPPAGPLDQVQQLAVARALATPDLALIQGYPGTGKTRVIAELLRQADEQGLRTLLLAPEPATLDGTLEHLAAHAPVRILRHLSATESLQALPGCAARLTLTGRMRHFEEHTLPAARQALSAARALCDARRRDEAVWTRLGAILERLSGLEAEAARLEPERQGLDAAVLAAVEQCESWRKCQQVRGKERALIDTRLAEVRAEIAQLAGEEKTCETELSSLQPLAEAREAGKWWTMSWLRSRLHGNVAPRVEELHSKCSQLGERLQALHREEEELSGRSRQSDEAQAEERRRLVEAERARRLADLQSRQVRLARQRDEALADWKAASDSLSEGIVRPAEHSRASLDEAHSAWQVRRQRDEQELPLRQDWLQALEQAQPDLPAYLARSARIVAATTADLPVAGEFDLLVIEEAHRLTEADLLAAARRARRWVLVGEPPVHLPAPPSPRPAPNRSRTVTPRPAFERLWNALHTDPRSLATQWRLTEGRLIAQLRPVPAEQERWVQREPVFDRPEIEVGIVSPPRQEPQVVEVSFPSSTDLAEARTYIYRELEELAVQPAGPVVAWQEDDATIGVRFDLSQTAEQRTVPLDGGVSEVLVHDPRLAEAGEVAWRTAGLTFDRAAGWDRDRARAWVEDRLGLRDLGRTTVLARPYRAQAPLARFLSGLLYAGAAGEALSVFEPLSDRPAVEFVPVPALTEGGWGEGRRVEPEPRRGGAGTATLAPRLRSVRGGAGLEVELADVSAADNRSLPRRTDALPGELRPQLPARGLINYLEAQALVSALEALVSDPAFQQASDAWQRRGNALCPSAAPTVAVLCLFPAQAELLRLLVQRSAVLAGSRVPFVVGRPADLAQRECLVALVGLTRSHTHRAVPFSDAPTDLVRALTRPAGRLVLFGDPGTMARRSQWHGALDHLDESAGSAEQGLIAQLLTELTGSEAARTFARGGGAEERAGRPRENSSV